jgi:hypothetical protein
MGSSVVFKKTEAFVITTLPLSCVYSPCGKFFENDFRLRLLLVNALYHV